MLVANRSTIDSFWEHQGALPHRRAGSRGGVVQIMRIMHIMQIIHKMNAAIVGLSVLNSTGIFQKMSIK